ncbi:MAG: hypothetical protein AVDCRST_MAG34-841 [uncultured Nocardioidaceae bacterium]|uniref:Mycothiol-dependent maleylpyruvate isomerase metal-binding domain-containing protein n=1 Tax=uncultured Nocardioidaceae bacterium TaxID=253824 RepID=A0A6J4LM00_9ACTN|nr:MAG: hypothetical protein AVDCRST_MAG34-841 [uncultured Nocardioidaceae bacterium]
MTSIAASERALLCALAEEVGPGAPTLCAGWTVRDLVVHLLVREGHPAGLATALPPLTRLLRRTTAKLSERDFGSLVQRLRHGPPRYSPLALPGADAMVNLLELYVHHEDIRRAQPDWAPRPLPARTENGIWRTVTRTGRALTVRSTVGVVAERSDTGERATWKGGEDAVVLRGQPSELALYAFGRQAQAVVETEGDPADVAALDRASLGI